MTTFTHRGRVFEVQEFGPTDEPGFHYELWDLSADGGLVGRIVVPDPGDADDDIKLQVHSAVSAEVLIEWMRSVPELRDRLGRQQTGVAEVRARDDELR